MRFIRESFRVVNVQACTRFWAAAGFFIYLISIYFLDSSQQKTIFYLLCALPGLFLFPRFSVLLRQVRWPVLSVFAFLSYFSLSALWSGSEAAKDAIKFSLYILCLLLCIDVVMRSGAQATGRIVCFFIVLGGASALFYFAVLTLRGADFSILLAGRFSLKQLSGWGEDNPISSAVYFGIPVLAAWWVLPDVRWPKRIALVCVIVLCVTLMFISKSRGPMLSLLIALGAISLHRRDKGDLYLWGAVFLFSFGVFIFTDVGSILHARLAQPNYRSGIWINALSLIQENFWFGQGFGRSVDIPMSNGSTVTHSHSSIIEVFRVGGVIGGCLFGAMLLLCLGRLFSKDSASWFFASWLLFGLLCLSTNGRLPLGRPAIEWFCFWIPLFFTLFSCSSRNRESQKMAVNK